MSSSGRLVLTHHRNYHNQVTSPLLRLPAELRNSIYAYALGGYDIWIQARPDYQYLTFSTKSQGSDRPYYRTGAGRDLSISALSYTCRQIRYGSSHYVFALNTFRGDVDTLTRFLLHRNTKEAYVHSVRLDLDTKIDFDFSHEPKVLPHVLHGLRILRQLPSLKEIPVCSRSHCWRYHPSVMLAALQKFFEAVTEELPEPRNVKVSVSHWQ